MIEPMKRLRRGALFVGLCGICIVAACARAIPTEQPKHVAAVATLPAPVTVPAPTATPVPSPSPAYPGTYAGTPTPNPTPTSRSEGTGVESYVVQPGETLSLIAAVFGCTVEEVVAANGLANADSIRAGQTLCMPVSATEIGPALKLIPDSEMVYGPAYIHFDLAGFVSGQGGYLAGYAEDVEGDTLTGPEIVQLV